jgi:hypothetical protein
VCVLCRRCEGWKGKRRTCHGYYYNDYDYGYIYLGEAGWGLGITEFREGVVYAYVDVEVVPVAGRCET